MEQFINFLEALPVRQFLIVDLTMLINLVVVVLLFGRQRVAEWIGGALKQIRLLPDEPKE